MEGEPMFNKFTKALLVFAVVVSCLATSEAYSWQQALPSPKASVMQIIKTTEITVVYHRPSVTPPPDSRRTSSVIWGEGVPFSKVWRAGANNATTIEFGKDVTIQGEDLAAGLYSFWVIPERDEWTLIFSSEPDVWGTAYPGIDNDVLRVKTKPETAEHLERLTYYFPEVLSDSGVLYLHWEKIRVPINIKVK